MKQIIYQKFIQRSDLLKFRKVIYVFGDNDCRKGYGGQAKEMRGESNSIGIRVKKRPSNDITAYYTDKEYKDNIKKINEDFARVKLCIEWANVIVIPSDGIGTGLARLEEFAPKTLKYIQRYIKNLERVYNEF